MVNSFYWGGNADERKLNWIRWDSLAIPKSFGRLGFRSFHAFNKEMLGKQWWRLMSRGDSLMARMLKARYYQKTEPGEAKRGTNSSFLWKSLYAAKDMIKKGSMWKVGDGKEIEIWIDSWIPSSRSGRVTTTKPTSCTLSKVSQLIDCTGRMWNHQLIRTTFLQMDVEKILQIPLSPENTTDKLIWKDSINGQYSVKGGYKILREIGHEQADAGPSNSRESQLWKKIWAVEVLPSCKEFIWRACKDVLPVYTNLKRRGMELETTCQLCGERDETTTHALLSCSRTCRIWFGSHLGIQVPQNLNDNFKAWLEKILQHPSQEIKADVLNLAWTIWKRRNNWVFERQLWDFDQTLLKASRICISREQKHDDFFTEESPSTWKPPDQNEYKLNVDAANRQTGTAFGAIIRNEKGETMAAATRVWQAQEDPTMAEALGAKWALEWARQIGFMQIALETDSLVLVQQWKSNRLGDSYLHDVIRSCRTMSLYFHPFSVSHVKRSGNRVADYLAHLAFTVSDQCWIKEDPPGTSNLINLDVSPAVSSATS